MKKESLIKLREEIIKAVMATKGVDEIDKAEIGIMEMHLLEPSEYEENRKVLQKRKWERHR